MGRGLALRRMGSGEIARKRLQFLLTSDKTGLPPETLKMMKDDIGRVVSRYMETDTGQIEICIGSSPPIREPAADFTVLYTVIPMKGLRCRRTV